LFSQTIYRTTTPMPMPRQMYGSAVLGNYLYLLGGNEPDKDYLKSVQMAHITETGALENWQDTTPLPVSLSYIENTTLALNDVLYVVGGWDGITEKCMNVIHWTRPKADGHLEGWRTSPPYPGMGIQCSTAIATPGYIHLIGGLREDDTVEKAVWTARVAPDGSIVGWEPGPDLPTTLWYHCAGVAGGYAWVWGGLTLKGNKSVNATIYGAPILSSGKLGAWGISPTSLPRGFFSASCTVSGSFLFSFCPRYAGGGATATGDIWYTEVTPTRLAPWTREATDLKGKLYLGLATDYRRGIIYIPGGRVSFADKTTIDRSVRYFKLSGQAIPETAADTVQTVDRSQVAAGDVNLSFSAVSDPSAVLPGFQSLVRALEQQAIARRPMVIYFHQDRARLCQKQSEILKLADLTKSAGKIVLVEVNAIQYPQTSQQFGVFRVPTWFFYNEAGKLMKRENGVIAADRLSEILASLAP